ncbi:MAG: LysR family transcriptional regulator [Paracoccaceae bacterium]|jgi:DNA-binding transcriptional LysR family regulator|nr:LysR family transcriptional regulator [Paracoccaceae bacterium]
MTIRRLRTLVAIAETETFSAAADVVHVTHAAVSQQMQALEAELGVTLFDRSTRTPQLTSVAQRIVIKARKLIADYNNLVPSALNDSGLGGTIALGVLRTTLTGLTPRAMSVLTSRHPDLGLRIKPGLTVTLLAEIERGNLDAALTSQPHQMPANMQFRPLVKEPMQLITALEEPIDDPIMLLKSRPFIRFDRTAVVGALIDNWILSKRIDVDETMELDSPEAITGMVQANLGVSIVPDLAVKPDDGALVKRISLGADAPTRTLGLIYRADQVKNHAIDAVFSALSDVISAPAE